ncbi:chloride channel protein [Paenibacillus marinisediminis]
MDKESLNFPKHKFISLLTFVVYVLLCGAVIGAVTTIFLQFMHHAIHFLWTTVPNAIPSSLSIGGMTLSLYPIVICVIGGVLIGLWQKKYGDYPRTLEEIIGTYKKEKHLRYDNLLIVCVAALLPLIFGGSIGPEAGLAGIIAALLSWIRDRYKSGMTMVLEDRSQQKRTTLRALMQRPVQAYIGTEIEVNSQSYTISKQYRWIIYIIATIGAIASFRVVGNLLAKEGIQLASFTSIEFSMNELLAFIPLVLAGILCGALFLVCQWISKVVFAPLENKKVLRAVIAGFILGAVGMFLPDTMFAGEAQMFELSNDWKSWAIPMLLLTGFIKIFMINICISGGWRGGNFFPILFSATAIGFALSTFLPVDVTFVVLTFMAAFTATALGQPLIVAILCLLFAPLNAIIAIVVSAFIGGKFHTVLKKGAV